MTRGTPLYLDTSVVLRAVLERRTSPDIEERIAAATALITSRLSHVEAARAFHRVRGIEKVSPSALADATRDVSGLWARCDTWELTAAVCRLAADIAPAKRLRMLDALHLATFVLARERIPGLELLTADARLRDAGALA